MRRALTRLLVWLIFLLLAGIALTASGILLLAVFLAQAVLLPWHMWQLLRLEADPLVPGARTGRLLDLDVVVRPQPPLPPSADVVRVIVMDTATPTELLTMMRQLRDLGAAAGGPLLVSFEVWHGNVVPFPMRAH